MNENGTPRHISVKFHNTEEKKESLKTPRENLKILYKGQRINMALDFSKVTGE